MASRKAAPSDLTNSKLAAEQSAADQRTDSAPIVKPTAAQIVRQSLRRSQDADRLKVLLKRCKDAAALELRGANYSPDDRLDAAADAMARIIAEYAPNVPTEDDKRVSLSVICGRMANTRRSIDAARERDNAEYLERAAERAGSAESVSAELVLERAAMNRAERSEIADHDARHILSALELAPNGPCHAVMYQWMRDADGPTCAAECGYSAGSWRVRISHGGKLIRAAYPDPVDLLSAILPDDAGIIDDRERGGALVFALRDMSREALTHGKTWTGRKLREVAAQWREGTDAGNRPVRPADADTARDVCKVTYRKADPAAAKRRDAARHGRRRMLVTGKSRRAVTVAGKSDQQALADALRTAAREHARQSRRTRERAVAQTSAIPATVAGK